MKYSYSNIVRFLNGVYYFGLKKRVYIRGKIFEDNRIKYKIGKGLRIYSFLKKVSFFGHGNLEIGNQVFINGGTIFECRNLIKIGDSVKIGYDCLLIDAENHSVNGTSKPENKPIIIEDNVWLGAKVTILPGVKVSKNSVVAAEAVITKDIPPNSLYGGVPAQIIKNIAYTSKKFRD